MRKHRSLLFLRPVSSAEESRARFLPRGSGVREAGTLKRGRSGKKMRSRKQAIAIGLSEARRAGLIRSCVSQNWKR